MCIYILNLLERFTDCSSSSPTMATNPHKNSRIYYLSSAEARCFRLCDILNLVFRILRNSALTSEGVDLSSRVRASRQRTRACFFHVREGYTSYIS